MSGIVRPKGGAPPSVYWRRRLILLAALLLITAGGFKLFGGGGGGGGEDRPQASTQPSTDDQEQTERQDRSDEKKEQKRRKRKRANNDVTAGERDVAVNLRANGTCDPAAVTVTPSLAVDSYAGGPVTLRLALSTTGDSACEFSLSEHEPLVSVSDGSTLVWESQRCDELIDVTTVRLEPGWLSYVDAAWSGRTSRHNCGDNADFADAGSYEVKAAVLGGEPTSTTVELAEKPEPKKADKKSEKGKKSGKDDRNGQQADEGDESTDQQSDEQDNQQSGEQDNQQSDEHGAA